jgi:phosphatidylglycerol:prolipoprotein diacylglycerol transferase
VWYVLNDIFGGGKIYLENPARIIRITDGGLHIFGAIALGALAAFLYARRNNVDMLLLLDSVAPALLIGQAIARPANYINQELYGPPTELPWGISIDEAHRLPPFNNLEKYPLETTRFHPTFLYEMLWNIFAAAIILWIARRFRNRIKPGTSFAAWLFLAGFGRVWIEFFRPDQPKIPGTLISYSQLIAFFMALAGAIWLLIRFEIVTLSFLSPGPESYDVPKDKKWKRAKSG